jgi:inner membrane protein
MDTITQALLGAACGNVCARRVLGRRAARWGAIGGALPDLDIVAAVIGGPWVEMAHHRGVTHALWFGPVVGPVIGWLAWRRYARLRAREPDHDDAALGAPGALRWWIAVLVVSLFSHPLLDVFTTYGTQIFAPFSRYRATVNAIGVVDPLYTIPLVVGLTWGKTDQVRKKVKASAVALALTTLYLFYGVWLNHGAEALAEASLVAQGIEGAEVHAYPRIFQIFQRRLVARAHGRIYVGQVSMFAPRPIAWHAFEEAQGPLVARTRNTWEGKLFEWFAMDQTAAHVERDGDATVVEIDDMRYGDLVEPERSMWGIRARFVDGEIERFRRPKKGGVRAALGRMMRDTFTPP